MACSHKRRWKTSKTDDYTTEWQVTCLDCHELLEKCMQQGEKFYDILSWNDFVEGSQ